MKKHEMPIGSAGIGRREFLVLSSTCAIGSMAIGPKLFAGALMPAASALPRALAVGFAASYSAIGATGDAFGVGFTPAEALTSPDGAFISRGAMVTIEGAGAGPADRRVTAVCAEYDVDVAGKVPVYSWAYNPGTGQAGGRNKFRMPLDANQKLRFLLMTAAPAASGRTRAVRAEPAVESPSALVLTTMNEPGALPLCRGYYAIVPLYVGETAPVWSEYALRTRNGQNTLFRKDDDSIPLDREHVVLQLDLPKSAS